MTTAGRGVEIQIEAVTLLADLTLPSDARVMEVGPLILERILLGLAWLWFINLFNFMDGIDGLAGSETIAVALGYLALVTYAGLEDPFWRLALVVAVGPDNDYGFLDITQPAFDLSERGVAGRDPPGAVSASVADEPARDDRLGIPVPHLDRHPPGTQRPLQDSWAVSEPLAGSSGLLPSF